MSNEIISAAAEGSIAAKWEQFVEENNISTELAEKLQPVFYSGAFAVFEELAAVTPSSNTNKNVSQAVMTYGALQAEVYSFFEDRDVDDLTILTVKDTSDEQTTDSQ